MFFRNYNILKKYTVLYIAKMLYKQIDKLSDELTSNFKRAQEDFARKHKLSLKTDSVQKK